MRTLPQSNKEGRQGAPATPLLRSLAYGIQCVCVCVSACSLTELEVTGVSIEATGAQQVAAVCSWRTITLSNNDQFYDNSWGWLPVPQNGKLVVKRGKPDVKGSILLNVALPLSDAVRHLLLAALCCHVHQLPTVGMQSSQ